MTYLMHIFLSAFIGLQLYDFWSTQHIHRNVPGGHETNRMLARLMGAAGMWPVLIVLKGGLIAGAVLLDLAIMAYRPGWAWFGALVFTVVSVIYVIKFRKTNFEYDGI